MILSRKLMMILLFILLATVGTGRVHAQGSSLTGTVYGCSAGSCTPQGGVSVTLNGCTPGVLGCTSSTTGPDGAFTLVGLEAGGNNIVFSLTGYNTVTQTVNCIQGGACSPSPVSVALQKGQPESGFTFSTLQLSAIGLGLLGVGVLIGLGTSRAVNRRDRRVSSREN